MKRIFRTVGIGVVTFAFMWLLGSVFVYNLMCFLIDYFYSVSEVVDFFNPQQKLLIFMIKYVETPCFLLSSMLYLLYEILSYFFGKSNQRGIDNSESFKNAKSSDIQKM